MLYSLLLYGIIDLMSKNIPARNGGGVRRVGLGTQWEVVASVHVRTMGRGSNSSQFGTYLLNE